MNREKRREVPTARTVPAAVLAAVLLVPGAGAEDVWAKETRTSAEMPAAREAPHLGADPVVVEMTVQGMACDLCVQALERRFKRDVEEIEDLEIDLETGKVGFRLPDGSKHTDEDLRKIVRSAGFAVERVERKPDGDGGA